ncbi:MAG: sialidase family protein [Anaerohalosphaeraceae bacterium]
MKHYKRILTSGAIVSVIILGLETLICATQPLTIDKTLPNSEVASRITPGDPPNKGILFVDHSANSRSGHLGHALVEYEKGKILAFYPNCSGDDWGGHSAVGWMEYKRSEDAGRTWGKPQELPFSKWLFEAGMGRTAMVEKAVATDQGEIILFYLICDISDDPGWEPYWTPLYSKSADGGKTWSDPKPLCSTRGRIFAVVYQDGEIRVLYFANDATVKLMDRKETGDCVYELYVSGDGGETFTKRSVLPFETPSRFYGSLGFLEGSKMIAYIYNKKDEYNLDYTISEDDGKTWSAVHTAYFSRKIRNPQFIAFSGKYYLHGRSGGYGDGCMNMILYMSEDGVNWDNGVYLRMKDTGIGAYSNSIVVHDKTMERLLIQASHAYEENRTNILHWWVDSSSVKQSEQD